jgi:hypothetical protein
MRSPRPSKREITREYTHFKVKNQLVCQLSFAWNDSAPLINRTSNIAAERGRKSSAESRRVPIGYHMLHSVVSMSRNG